MTKAPDDCRSAACCWDTSGKVPRKIEGDPTNLVLLIIIPMFVGITGCIAASKVFKILGDKGMQYARAKQLFLQSAIVIIWFGATSWGVQKYVNPCTDFDLWFNGQLGVTPQTVIIGMMANVVFGFIDNAGLFFGGCYLDEVFSLLPAADDANVGAGYGNTYSDLLGAFMGTFVGIILQDATGISEGPLWANAIGIVVGCLLGIAIPKLIVGNSQTVGLNKISARQVLLGSMENEELEAIVEGKKTLFQFRVEQTFKKLDSDGSGALDVDEIRNYMVEAMGEDFNEEQFQIDLKEIFQVHHDNNDQELNFEEFMEIYKNMAYETLKNRQKDEERKKNIEMKKRNSKISDVEKQPLENIKESKDIDDDNNNLFLITSANNGKRNEEQENTPNKKSIKPLDPENVQVGENQNE